MQFFQSKYPLIPPLWSTQQENEKVQQVLDFLNKTTGLDNEILNQFIIFVTKMCHEFSLPCPFYELQKLKSHSEDRDLPSTSNSHQNNQVEPKTNNDDELISDDSDDEVFNLTEEEIKEDESFKKLFKRKDYKLDDLNVSHRYSKFLKIFFKNLFRHPKSQKLLPVDTHQFE